MFDNTAYTAYFIGENNLPGNPDLMLDSEIIEVPFMTHREIFVIPKQYSVPEIGRNLMCNLWLALILIFSIIFT